MIFPNLQAHTAGESTKDGPHTTDLSRVCGSCGESFVPRRRDTPRKRRGVYCSAVCQRREAIALAQAAPRRDTAGPLNANWRGGRASRPYESYVKHFKAAHPEKVKAHQIVAWAIRAGRLVRPAACSQCAAVCRVQAHHENYAHPLKVDWLCKKCHEAADRRRREREARDAAATLRALNRFLRAVPEETQLPDPSCDAV